MYYTLYIIYYLFHILYCILYTIYIRRPLPWPRQGRRLGPPEVWNLLCHGHGPHIPATIACLCLRCAKPQRPQTRRGSSHDQTFPYAFPRQLSQLHAPDNASNPSASLSKATLAATGPTHCFKPFRKPFQGNSRSCRPQPSVFKGVQDCRLPAFKPLKPLKPFRRPFQGNSCSFPQAFPRQLSQQHARDNASNPSPSLSKATLAATRPRQRFKPFRRPFQGNSRSYRLQPSVFKGVQDCRLLKPLKPLKPFRRPFQGNSCSFLSKATLAATRPRQSFKPFRKPFQGNSCSFPQAFPRQLSQLHAPDNALNPSESLSTATLAATAGPSASVFKCVQNCRLPAFKPLKPFKPFRRPFQGNSCSFPHAFPRHSRSYTPETMLQTLPQEFPRQLSQLQASAICF